MIHKHLLVMTSWLAMGAAFCGQPETPIQVVEANEPTVLHYGAHALGGVISPATDVDLMTFQGEAGDSVRIRLRSLSNGFDPQIALYAPDFSLVKTAWCDGSGPPTAKACTLALDVAPLPMDGDYRLVITDVGFNESGAYVLQLERFLPRLPPPGIPNNVTILESIAPSTDFDHLRFEGTSGSIVLIAVQSLSDGLDPQVELVAPDGSVVHAQGCSGSSPPTAKKCSFSFQTALPMDGTYTLVLSEGGSDESGSVNVSVTCLLGNCAYSPAGLTVDVPQVSLSTGGGQALLLDAGPTCAQHPYLVMGSATGVCPGLPLTTDLWLPLSPDAYFYFTLNRPFQAPFSATSTTLDGAGKATVTLQVPAGSPAALVGLKLRHAFVSFAGAPSIPGIGFVSNPVELELTP